MHNLHIASLTLWQSINGMHTQFLRQSVTLVGLHMPTFIRVIENIAEIHALFGRSIGHQNLQECGIISMCQGATQNYAGILACRFFLGAAEAGFYPGVLYHLSFWYPTDKLPLRIGFFYACGMFSGTISGLLAYAISFMNGLGGLAGWRWLFILEGIPAILCAVYTWFFLPNFAQVLV